MAGSRYGSARTVEQLVEIATGIGRPARQRSTCYGEVPPERRAAAAGRVFLPLA